MAKIMIKDLQVETTVDSVFIVKKIDKKSAKNGKDYLALTLSDMSGEIEARFWENFEEFYRQLTEEKAELARVFADVTEYNNQAQLTVRKAKVAEPNEYELADLISHTTKNIAEMFQSLQAIIETIADPDLKKLLNTFFSDEKFVEKYKKAPAAVRMHSACIGGLLEHVSNVLNMALFIASEYKNIDRDLLLTGVILHDIGKVDELDYQLGFKYSDRGKLVGHITMGVVMINEKIKELGDFPAEKKIKLEHLLLAHHGEAEFGSPKQPMTLEAIVLNLVDNLDAKINGWQEFVDKNTKEDDTWSPRAYMFGNRELFIK